METDTDLEGEVLSPTQPFPTKPPPFEYQGISIDDLVDFTPEIRAMAVEAVRNFRLGPLFTPPDADRGRRPAGHDSATRTSPAGASWGGAAADPETGLIYVPSVNSFSVIKYYTPDPAEGGNLRYTQADFDSGTQPTMPQGLPLLKPPYSRTDRHRPQRRRARLDAAERRRRPLPQSPACCATWTCRRWAARAGAARY